MKNRKGSDMEGWEKKWQRGVIAEEQSGERYDGGDTQLFWDIGFTTIR